MVPSVRRTWLVPLRKPSPPWWQALSQLREIRSLNYDAALTFSGADRNLFCVALSGARERIAVTRRDRWWLSFLPLTKTIPTPQKNQPVFRQRIEALKTLDWSGDSPGWSLQVPPLGDEKAISHSSPTIYFSVSAFGSPHKEWPLENWAATARLVWERRPETKILVGFAPGKREKNRAHQLVGLAGNSQRCRALDAPPTLGGLAFILQKVELFAGLDSGVLHLAMALGRPTVSVFRDYSGKSEWAPEGARHRVLSHFCSCHHNKVDRCGSQPECLAAVAPELVAKAILELLPSPSQRK